MAWWQAFLVAIGTLVVTKFVDQVVASLSDKTKFKRHRREQILLEIENLKDQVGVIYEIASNWRDFDSKQQDYFEEFDKESKLLGKYNKYPKIAMAARDVLHYCKLVADAEKNRSDDLALQKRELGAKFAAFIDECEAFLASLV